MTALLNSYAAFGTQEMIIILVIVLVLFGGSKIPALMRGVGRGVGELQEGLKEGKRNFTESMNATDSDDETTTPSSSKVDQAG